MKPITTEVKLGIKTVAAAIAAAFAVITASAGRIDVYPQSFDAGGWGIDVQLMDVIGSPYLIAHGRGIRVTDATASVSVPETGRWSVYVRTRKWVDGAGRFKVVVGERELNHVFGKSQSEWAWEKGGELELSAGETEVRLVDLDGFDARMAGLVLVKDEAAPEGALSLADAAVAKTVEADFVVVGGGLPGTCAAVAAARRGLRVAILNDRPVLGGNASSEIRVWSGGEARYPLVKELRGWFMNRDHNMALSDANRMRIVANEKTLSAHLCMRAFAAETKDGRITAVKALDWKRNRVVRFTAPLFCDATGDGWVGFWSGADYRMGREAKSEYNESFAPEKADGDTLGASLMWSSAEANTDMPFSAPWAEKWACGEKAVVGKWNWEYGIHHDMFKDAEWIRDRLLLAIYGAFSLAKKDPENSRLVIDFLPFILGKRESRRLMGDWVFSETDVTGKRPFEDAIASGSWSVDLHYDNAKPGVDFLTTCNQPYYGRYYIPYRSIYSRNIRNLFMAGRCFSCTHVGLGSPRVMNTLAQLGVAAGEAAAMCKELGCDPRGIYTGGHYRKLQRILGGDFPGNPDPAKKDWLIVDNDDKGVVFGGNWRKSFCDNGEQVGETMRVPVNGAKKAVYPLPVDKAGRYRLYGRVPYRWYVARPASTAIKIESAGAAVDLKWDQTQRMGEWIDLGVLSLEKGATLTIDPEASTGTLIADGFALVPEKCEAAVPLSDSAVKVKPFAAGERVVVLGDSITHGGSYVGNLQLFQCLRNPGCGTVFMSAGLSGDTAGGCLGRFGRDVAEKRPDRVFVMFGMNDVGHNFYTKDAANLKDLQVKRDGVFTRYEANMNKVHDLIAKTGAKAVYITPTPYDEYAANLKKAANKDCNEYGLFTLAGIVRKLAGEKNSAFVELYKPFTELVKKHPGRFHGDRVHPGPEGHLIMAAMIFEQAGNSPIVGKCEIDADELPYRYEPEAFPLPLSDLYRKAEEVYPLTEKLNREMIVIKGLKPGMWTLCADGKALGDFTAEALASGVNIAVLPTPGQLEAQRLAKVAGSITSGMSRMCTFFAMYDRVVKCGGNPENQESAFSSLDRWVAGMYSNKVSSATYYSNCVKSFKKMFNERAAIEKDINDKRAELNAARPKPYVISVKAVR